MRRPSRINTVEEGVASAERCRGLLPYVIGGNASKPQYAIQGWRWRSRGSHRVTSQHSSLVECTCAEWANALTSRRGNVAVDRIESGERGELPIDRRGTSLTSCVTTGCVYLCFASTAFASGYGVYSIFRACIATQRLCLCHRVQVWMRPQELSATCISN
jgi:hypothetical protein